MTNLFLTAVVFLLLYSPLQAQDCFIKHGSALLQSIYGTEAMRKVWEEEQIIQQWLNVEAAIANAQRELGLLSPEVARTIVDCCTVKLITPQLIALHKKRVGHLMVATMHAFAEVCPSPAGEMLHLGATTQDILDTGILLQIREALELIGQDLDEVHAALCALAQRHKHTAMMGRTHGQHATPITFGFKAALWASEIADHRDRLNSAARRLLFSNLSGAVGSNASFQFLLGGQVAKFQRLVAQQLNLGVSPLDLHQRTDRFTELVNVLAMIGTTLGRIGLEIRELQRPEIGELEEPLTLATQYASSTMPNKRNPSLCEYQDGLAKLLRANASAISQVTMQHERDSTWLAVEMAVIPESFLLASSALNMAKTVLGGLVVHPERMRRNLHIQHGIAMAEPAMLALYRATGKKLEAHRICYEAAMQAVEQEKPFVETLLAHPEIDGLLNRADLDEITNPEKYIGNCASQVDAYLATRSERNQKNAVPLRIGKPLVKVVGGSME